MDDVLSLVIPWAASIALLFLIVVRDERRMPSDMLARAWPSSTRASAIVCFGLLALPVHFGRTRRSLKGVALGVAWAIAVALVEEGLAEGLDVLYQRLRPE